MVLGGPGFTDITGLGVASEQTFVSLDAESALAKRRRFSPEVSQDYKKILRTDRRFRGTVESVDVPWYGVDDFITWNGFKIYISKVNETVGNRLQTHVYQNAVNPYTQRLGRKARRWSFSGFLIGHNSRSDKEVLKKAIETGLVGETVFPSVGLPVQTYIESASFNESIGKNLIIDVSVTFVEAGVQPQLPFSSPNVNVPSTLIVSDNINEEVANNIIENVALGLPVLTNAAYDNELLDYALTAINGYTLAGLTHHILYGCEQVRTGYRGSTIEWENCENAPDLTDQSGAGFEKLQTLLFDSDNSGALQDVEWLTIIVNLDRLGSTLYEDIVRLIGQTQSVTETLSPEMEDTEIAERTRRAIVVVNRVGAILLNIASRKLALEITRNGGVSEIIRSQELDVVRRSATDSETAEIGQVFLEYAEGETITQDALEEEDIRIINAKRAMFRDAIDRAFFAIYRGQVYGQGTAPEFQSEVEDEQTLRNHMINRINEQLDIILNRRIDVNFQNIDANGGSWGNIIGSLSNIAISPGQPNLVIE